MNTQTSSTIDFMSLADSERISKQVCIQVPQRYYHKPIISELISLHQLEVNISAALVGANGRGDGWFDLELKGLPDRIQAALNYLSELGIDFWNDDELWLW